MENMMLVMNLIDTASYSDTKRKKIVFRMSLDAQVQQFLLSKKSFQMIFNIQLAYT